VILLFAFAWFSIACLRFFQSFLFFSSSLWLPFVCAINALIEGEIESLCGSTTGGWLLLGVMSD
jgi:hypothetical protein